MGHGSQLYFVQRFSRLGEIEAFWGLDKKQPLLPKEGEMEHPGAFPAYVRVAKLRSLTCFIQHLFS
jgi:hypothetical protein